MSGEYSNRYPFVFLRTNLTVLVIFATKPLTNCQEFYCTGSSLHMDPKLPQGATLRNRFLSQFIISGNKLSYVYQGE